MGADIEILSKRFLLRELDKGDATERYLNWLNDVQAKRYISAAQESQELSDLRHYIAEHSGRADVLFLGIFKKSNGVHIGNIKYEPLDSVRGYAVMGILIGDPAYRGKGVAKEVIEACAIWLKQNRNIKQIVLGVSKENKAAIHAYKKAGFREADSPFVPKTLPTNITMVSDL